MNPPAPAWTEADVGPPVPPPESVDWSAEGEGGGGCVVPLLDGDEPDEHAEAITAIASIAARPNPFMPTPPRFAPIVRRTTARATPWPAPQRTTCGQPPGVCGSIASTWYRNVPPGAW